MEAEPKSDVVRDPAPSKEGIEGRQRELDILHRWFKDASESRGACVLIAGEPGIGKTTLAQAFSEQAEDSGARVVWGRCWEGGGAPAYWPWVGALRDALATAVLDEDSTSVRPYLDVVSTLIPEIAGPGAVDGRAGVETERERFVLFDAVTRVVQAMGRTQPLVVVLDDLHAADPSSLLLLRFVARDIRTSRCLIVGTYRDREVEADPFASETLTEVAREGQLLHLAGLDTDAVATILQRSTGIRPSDALMRSLHDITQGNPFYANEMLRLLEREGRLETRLDLSRRSLPVPDSVRDTVLRRVRRLDPAVKELLEVASVIGKEFRLPLLAQAAAVPSTDLRQRLSVADSEGIIRAVDAASYAFDHGLIREGLYETIDDERRAGLHAAVAEALENEGVTEGGENLTEIAHHYLRASLDDAGPPYSFALRAGKRALAVLAYEQAVELLEEALTLSPLVKVTPEEKSDLLRSLGEALLWAGRITEAKERLAEAAEQARAAGSPESLAATAITYGNITVEGGIVNHEFVDLTRDALEQLGEGSPRDRGMLLGRWGHELALTGGKEDRPRRDRMSREGLAMVRAHGNEIDLSRSLRFRFSALIAPDRWDELLQIADELVGLGLSTRDPVIQIMGRTRRAVVLISQGRASDLDAEWVAIQRLLEDVHEPVYTSPLAFFRACLVAMRSGPRNAFAESDAALAVGPEVPNAGGANLLQHITWRWETDGGGDFEPFARVAMEQRPGIRRAWTGALAGILARTGRAGEAAALVDDLVTEIDEWPVDSVLITTIHCAADTLRILGRTEGAQQLYDALLPYRGQHMIQAMVAPVVYYGAVEWDLGTLAALVGKPDVAEEHFERALVEHSRMGARAALGWSQVELAGLLIENGADPERADALLQEGLSTAREWDLTFLKDRAEALASSAPSPSIERGRGTQPASMIREGEYVTVTRADEVVRLRHSKGLVYLATLLKAPRQELHVLEIASPGSSANRSSSEGLELASDDAGALLDPKAKAAYKRRIEELREDLEEATAFNDPARAERAQEELDFIAAELAGAVGLGGRDRKTSSNAERARVNVTKRIKTTMDKIASGAPDLARHLEATVKTGTFLSYSDRIEPTLEWDIRLGPTKT